MKTLTALRKEKDSLEKEITKRTKAGKKIRGRIVRYRKEIARLEAALGKLSGARKAKARRKPKKVRKKPARKRVKKRQKKARVRRKRAVRIRKKKRLTRREMVVKVLSEAKKPMNLDEIVKALIAKGYPVKSKNPKRLLSVTMYTGKTFKKVKPGYFTVSK